MNFHFVFVHGWGVSSRFWDDLIACLPGIEASRVDLGFIGTKPDFLDGIPGPSIYVTHSLGTMWALKNRHADMKALVSINGFGCFKNFVDERDLLSMKARLKRTPEIQMKEFWEAGGLSAYDDLNIDRLQAGLEWLMSWDVRAELERLKCPVLSLAGRDDPILPVGTMKEEWSGFDLHVRNCGGHALPLSDPQWCADHMKEFLHEL